MWTTTNHIIGEKIIIVHLYDRDRGWYYKNSAGLWNWALKDGPYGTKKMEGEAMADIEGGVE